MVVSWPLTKENYVHGRKDKFNHAHKHTRYIYIYMNIYIAVIFKTREN